MGTFPKEETILEEVEQQYEILEEIEQMRKPYVKRFPKKRKRDGGTQRDFGRNRRKEQL